MTHDSVRRWLEEHTLIERSLLEGAGLEMLVAERLGAFGGSEPEYVAELARSSDEVDRLVAGIAVPETWLFRYPRSFDLLVEFCRGRLSAGATTLRMLSVGCATGQEPYCMAMAALHAGWPADRMSVVGMDRNRGFLRSAEAGEYGPSSIRTEVPAWAVSFLRRRGDLISIDDSVRGIVRFTRADITEPLALSGAGPCDVVFCRNLLIYLNAAARERLMKAVCGELVCGGLLFVGHAEQVLRGGFPLRTVSAPHAFALERIDIAAVMVERPLTGVRAPALSGVRRERPVATANTPARPLAATPVDESLEDARDLADSGRAADGEAMVRAIIARHGPTAPSLELLGMIRASLNDVAGAKRLFEQAVYLEPARSASLLQLALISERSGDAGRASSYWDRAKRASAPPVQEPRS